MVGAALVGAKSEDRTSVRVELNTGKAKELWLKWIIR